MFMGSKLAEDNGFLRAIKICSTTSFRGKDNLAVPSREILRHVKDPYSMKHILVGESGIIRNKTGSTTDQ
jgi:hypothetical protein